MASSSSIVGTTVSEDVSLLSITQGDELGAQAKESRERGKKRPNSSVSTDSVDEGAPKKGIKRSWTWAHFTKIIVEGNERALCHYCKNVVCRSSKSGTFMLSNHLGRCSEYPPNVAKNQQFLSLQSDITGGNHGESVGGKNTIEILVEKKGRLDLWKFNQLDTRIALSEMIIMDERPFRMVEHDGFQLFCSIACPYFKIHSRWTVVRDCFNMCLEEKTKLKTYFSNLSSRVCLTTDTWTSCQNLGYMCLTAHFIDHNWKFHKRITNFCPIVGHTGEIIGKSIESYLIEWGLTTKVLTVMVDNASANVVGVEYLIQRLSSWGGTVLDGNFLQIRCVADHILSVIVKEGLKEANDFIYRIHNDVRFVRFSPARLLKFNHCVKKVQIDSIVIFV